jgi:hypothetical protein
MDGGEVFSLPMQEVIHAFFSFSSLCVFMNKEMERNESKLRVRVRVRFDSLSYFFFFLAWFDC